MWEACNFCRRGGRDKEGMRRSSCCSLRSRLFGNSPLISRAQPNAEHRPTGQRFVVVAAAAAQEERKEKEQIDTVEKKEILCKWKFN